MIFHKNVSYTFEIIWYIKTNKLASPGGQNPEIMELLGFGPSHNKSKILLDPN